MFNPRKAHRQIAAAGLIGFPLAGLAAALLDSNEGTDTPGAELYAIASTHGDAILASGLIFMLSAVLVVPAAAAVVHLVRGRGATPALIGSGFLVLGGFGHMGFATWQVILSTVPHDADRAAMSAFLDRQQSVTTPVLLPLLLSIALGVLLQAIALRRARLVPGWFLAGTIVLLGFDLVMNSTSLESWKLPIVFVWASLTALYGYFGVRVLAMGDERWATPAPVEIAPVAAAARCRLTRAGSGS